MIFWILIECNFIFFRTIINKREPFNKLMLRDQGLPNEFIIYSKVLIKDITLLVDQVLYRIKQYFWYWETRIFVKSENIISSLAFKLNIYSEPTLKDYSNTKFLGTAWDTHHSILESILVFNGFLGQNFNLIKHIININC